MKIDKNRPTIATVLHSYYYNVSDKDQAKAYAAELERMKANGPRECFNVICSQKDGYRIPVGTHPVALETSCVFENQWNTADGGGPADGMRVFDWFEEYMPHGYNKHIKRGHWLELTAETAALRSDTYKCGYCGAHYYDHKGAGPSFCSLCLDSPHLRPENFPLLRLRAVADEKKNRAPLSEGELAELQPLYVHAQTVAEGSRAKARAEKERADILTEYEKSVRNATVKRDGLIWLMDAGLNTENVIYYDHKNAFCFGWRSPIAPAVAENLREKLAGFPFNFEIRGAK